MSKKIQSLYFLLFGILQISLIGNVKAQEQTVPGFDLLFGNFKHVNHYLGQTKAKSTSSLSKNIFVDTDRVIAILEASDYNIIDVGYSNIYYISIHRLDGTQIILKPFSDPNNLGVFEIQRTDYNSSIQKLDNGNYAIQLLYYPKNRKETFYPVLCIFNKEGEILELKEIDNWAKGKKVYPKGLEKTATGELLSIQYESLVFYYDSALVLVENNIFWDYKRENNLLLSKYHPDGEIAWTRKIETPAEDSLSAISIYGISSSPDGEYYVIAGAKTFNYITARLPRFYIIDNEGNYLKTLSIPRSSFTDSIWKSGIGASLTNTKVHFKIGKDGYIYYVISELLEENFNPNQSSRNQKVLQYGKMDINGNIVWSKLFDYGFPVKYVVGYANLELDANGDIVICTDVVRIDKLKDKNFHKGLLIKASSKDGEVKWWKDLRTFDFNESHVVKEMRVDPVNGNIGFIGEVSFSDELTPLERATIEGLRKELNVLYRVSWLVLLDNDGRRCEADSLYGEIIPPNCPRPRLLIDPQMEIEADIILYPNPTQDWLTVAINRLKEVYPGQLTCEIYDMLGRKLQSVPLVFERTNLDFTTYVPAVYMVAIFHNGELVFSGKVRKQ